MNPSDMMDESILRDLNAYCEGLNATRTPSAMGVLPVFTNAASTEPTGTLDIEPGLEFGEIEIVNTTGKTMGEIAHEGKEAVKEAHQAVQTWSHIGTQVARFMGSGSMDFALAGLVSIYYGLNTASDRALLVNYFRDQGLTALALYIPLMGRALEDTRATADIRNMLSFGEATADYIRGDLALVHRFRSVVDNPRERAAFIADMSERQHAADRTHVRHAAREGLGIDLDPAIREDFFRLMRTFDTMRNALPATLQQLHESITAAEDAQSHELVRKLKKRLNRILDTTEAQANAAIRAYENPNGRAAFAALGLMSFLAGNAMLYESVQLFKNADFDTMIGRGREITSIIQLLPSYCTPSTGLAVSGALSALYMHANERVTSEMMKASHTGMDAAVLSVQPQLLYGQRTARLQKVCEAKLRVESYVKVMRDETAQFAGRLEALVDWMTRYHAHVTTTGDEQATEEMARELKALLAEMHKKHFEQKMYADAFESTREQAQRALGPAGYGAVENAAYRGLITREIAEVQAANRDVMQFIGGVIGQLGSADQVQAAARGHDGGALQRTLTDSAQRLRHRAGQMDAVLAEADPKSERWTLRGLSAGCLAAGLGSAWYLMKS